MALEEEGAVDVDVAPNPNVLVLPPNGVLVGALVLPPEPNVNGVAVDAPAVGAVLVVALPNANEVALGVVVVEDPLPQNIVSFSKK